jgi:hypothetical protein
MTPSARTTVPSGKARHPKQVAQFSTGGVAQFCSDGDNSAERLDAACAKALALGTPSYSSVAAILKNKQESKTAPRRETDQPSLLHDNIRGPGYYH